MRVFPTLAVAVLAAAPAGAQQTEDDFASSLWSALEDARMVGEGAVRTRPYEGTEPHGAILEYLEDEVEVAGNNGVAIVKRNYGGEDASIERVWSDGRDLLASVTVMYRREGYDPEHGNWYWAKYGPDGGVDTAGKVESCIACHEGAPGDDYLFSFNR